MIEPVPGTEEEHWVDRGRHRFHATGSIELGFSRGAKTTPIKLELSYERETTTKASVKTSVVPGKRFTTYPPRREPSMERCWSTQ